MGKGGGVPKGGKGVAKGKGKGVGKLGVPQVPVVGPPSPFAMTMIAYIAACFTNMYGGNRRNNMKLIMSMFGFALDYVAEVGRGRMPCFGNFVIDTTIPEEAPHQIVIRSGARAGQQFWTRKPPGVHMSFVPNGIFKGQAAKYPRTAGVRVLGPWRSHRHAER